jgi:hypothetical protein
VGGWVGGWGVGVSVCGEGMDVGAGVGGGGCCVSPLSFSLPHSFNTHTHSEKLDSVHDCLKRDNV